ncbi:MAG: type II secretion system F family protein [Sedimentisphaerales bacterium]|nr:type II secretion system F family protein [Sedimentisphaerales bacterium]
MQKAKLASVYGQLATLLGAGMPMTRSLDIIVNGCRGRLKKVFSAIDRDIGQGSQLHEAMAEHKSVFAPFDVAICRAAEQSGNLAESMKMLEQWYDFRAGMIRMLLSGLAYPLFILHIGFFLGPLPSAILGKTSWDTYFGNVLTALALLWGIVFVLFWLLKLLPQRGIVRKVFDFFLLQIPLLGRAIRDMAYARFCRSFYMLYSSGIPIVDAASTAVNMSGNAVVTMRLEGGAESVCSGEVMHKGFSKSVPMEIRNLWEVGEESGELDKTSRKLADMYLDSSQRWFKEFTS